MTFSENFIRKPIMTMLVMVSILIFGIVAYNNLPISDLPVVDFPVITVEAYYPGTSPSMMAATVASPLENQFMSIPGIQSIISDNTDGQTKITLTFELDRSVDLAAPDVQAAIQNAMGDLPSDLPEPPSYSKVNPTETPIMYLMVTSDTLTPGQLYDYGNRVIGQRISIIEGVSQVQVWGAKTAIRIQINPERLASFGIGINEVAQALQQGTVTVPGGSLNGNVRTFSVEPQGQLLTAKDYEQLIIAYQNNGPVRLKDVGRCVQTLQNDVINVTYGRSDGKIRPGTVILAVSRAGGSNTVALAKRIYNLVETLKKEIPGSVELDVLYDASESIIESVNDVKETIFIALFLVVLVIFLFLGSLSDTIIPAIALPMSIVATFAMMYLLNFSLDNLSLMGLTLSVGFVVDDAIVVLENTVRLIEEGKKPFLAAIQSAKEITFTIISMTLSLAVIFIPLIFMGGVVGRIFREFSLTVIIAILCSGVLSLTLTPMMCARMLQGKDKATRMQKFVNKYIGMVIKKYGETLQWTLKRPASTIIIWVACFLGTVWLFRVLPQTFIPEGDSGAVYGQMVVPLGTSTTKVQKFQDKVNKILQEDPNVDKLISLTGIQPGADQSTGPFFAILKPLKERVSIQKVVQGLRVKMAKLTEGFAYLQAIPALKLSAGGESTAAGSKYSYLITGQDQDEVYKSAQELEKKMKALPGFVDIQNSVKLDMPKLELDILRDRASTLGITAQDIENVLGLAYANGKLTTYKTDVDQYYVVTEVEKEYQKRPENLSGIYIRSPVTKGLVPLASVVKIRRTVGPQDVPHYAHMNCATLSFNIQAGVPLGNATNALAKAADEVLPPGVTGQLQGEAQEFEESVASLGILIIIAIFIKYVILGILYESYVHPLTILTTLPVATFGGLLTLLIFGSELSLYAYVGIFMLLGIVAKNGIMMVDFAEENLKKGASDFDAIYQASIVRFRPILMTGLAAIMGAVPLALGYGADGASRQPLGLVVMGGLVFSQVVTLYVTPGLFLYMQKFQRRFLDKYELTRSVGVRPDEEA